VNGKTLDIAAGDDALEDYLGALLVPLVDAEPTPTNQQHASTGEQPVWEIAGDREETALAGVECLLLKAAGIALAVRREDVAAIRSWPIGYTVVGGGDGPITGRWRHEGLEVALIDTARVILPLEGQAALAPVPGRAHEVLLLADGQWGLVTETACESTSIHQEHIHWRGRGGRRPWLAGMVSEPRCALLNTEGLVAFLQADQVTEPGE
jgi:purine-binding chemotaxis protein CheW